MNDTGKEHKIAAAVLVGGRSTRMGRPKENMIIEGDGRTFLEKICDEIDACFPDCICARYLSVRKGQEIYRKGYVRVEDEYDDIGPLGGIISVLKRAKEDGADAVLFLACDMPGYDRNEICTICGTYKGEDILWARTDGKDIQPLASIYSTGILKAAMSMAGRGDHRLRDIGRYADRVAFYDSDKTHKYVNVNSPAEIHMTKSFRSS